MKWVEKLVREDEKGREDWDKSQEILLGVGAYYAPRAASPPFINA